MEVHHHSHPASGETHTSRKKWTHYLWEFLMLFLAVFCGFLAENLRESYVERHREKEYITSLINDLKYDTLQFKQIITAINNKLPYFDSLSLFFNDPPSYNNKAPYTYWFNSLIMAIYMPDEPTIEQLKSSGNFRLVKNKKLLDSILVYDNHIKGVHLSNNNYLLNFHQQILASNNKIFDNSNFGRLLDDWLHQKINVTTGYDLNLISKDQSLLKELSNKYIDLKITYIFSLMELRDRNREAEQLLSFIKKEYHLN